jgi:uncharacterized membrane protein
MNTQQTPTSLIELRKNRRQRNVNQEHLEKLTGLEKFAMAVTEKIGTVSFFSIIIIWTIAWIGWNAIAPTSLRFDPFPGFVLWLFISNMIQLLILPLIMIGQNLQGRHAEARAQADFEVNIQAEQEIETILQHLENQNSLILEILQKVDERK